eukprot:m.28768 g.28768  ORF g.28768 m.28768 type:complete len:475 (+) comp12052_c0_seq2:894-2318(+)
MLDGSGDMALPLKTANDLGRLDGTHESVDEIQPSANGGSGTLVGDTDDGSLHPQIQIGETHGGDAHTAQVEPPAQPAESDTSDVVLPPLSPRSYGGGQVGMMGVGVGPGGTILMGSPVPVMMGSPVMESYSPVMSAGIPGAGTTFVYQHPRGPHPHGHPHGGRGRGHGGGAQGGPRKAVGKRLFVGNLPKTCTLEDLTECIAENVAMPVEVRIIKDRETNTSKGYGFLTFASVQDAERCLAHSSITCQKRLLNFGPAKHKRRSDDFSAAAGNYAPVYNSAPVDPSMSGGATYYDPYPGAYNPGYAVGPPEYNIANQQYESYPGSGQVYWSQPAYGPPEGQGQGAAPLHYGYATNVPQIVPYNPSMDVFGLPRAAGSPIMSPVTMRRVEMHPAARHASPITQFAYSGDAGGASGPTQVILSPSPLQHSPTHVWASDMGIAYTTAAALTAQSPPEAPDMSTLQISELPSDEPPPLA